MVVINYATCYPEDMPLRDPLATVVVWEFAMLFTPAVFTKQVMVDQGYLWEKLCGS